MRQRKKKLTVRNLLALLTYYVMDFQSEIRMIQHGPGVYMHIQDGEQKLNIYFEPLEAEEEHNPPQQMPQERRLEEKISFEIIDSPRPDE